MREYVLFALMIVGLLGSATMFGFSIYHDEQCRSACGTDPIAKCYRDRVECVGMDKHYMAPVK